MKFKYPVCIFLYFVISLPLYFFFCSNSKNELIYQILYSILSISICCFLLLKLSKQINSKNELEKSMLYSVLDDIEAMIVVWSDDSSSIKVNSCFINKTGINPNDMQNNKLLSIIFGKDYNINTPIDGKDIPPSIECSFKNRNDKDMTILWKTTNTAMPNEKPLYFSVGIDLTEIKTMQSLLIKSEQQFNLAMELSDTGLLFRYIGTDKYLLSNNLVKIFGFDNCIISTNEFRSKVHPHDLNVYETYFNINEKSTRTSGSTANSIQFRLNSIERGYQWYNFNYKITRILNENNLAIGGSLINISSDKEKDSLIEKMAYIDDVTEIYNRNRFLVIGSQTYECIKNTCIKYFLIVFDVDKFHIINNTCGYHNGDILLKKISIQLLKNMSEESFCARIGGDNFAVLIKANDSDSSPIPLIKKIQADISSLAVNVFKNQTITASVGYCSMPDDGDCFSDLLEHAEFALRLDTSSRSKIVLYDNTIKEKIIAQENIIKELEEAIDNNEFVLYYQPKIRLSNGELIGAEALVRWIKPDGTIIPPDMFIPIAESSGLITRISKFVINEACKQIRIWQDKGLKNISISVNLSSDDFYQTDVCTIISQALKDFGIDSKWLEIELTESLALKDVEHAIIQMNNLKDIGIDISMDDFGTGYSSLSYIKLLPITVLKLDRSFIMNMEKDNVSKQIVSSVIDICKSKSVQIVAEGIETIQQANILKDFGCDIAQGYYFGKPMPNNIMENYLISHC